MTRALYLALGCMKALLLAAGYLIAQGAWQAGALPGLVVSLVWALVAVGTVAVWRELLGGGCG